jgi:radical SAM protein with 4Fe4S-binding SPASM domain
MEFLAYSKTSVKEKRLAFFRRFAGLSFDRVVLRKPHNVGGSVELNENQGYEISKKRYSPCSFPWYSLAIHWNGNICPCPRDFMGDMVVENVGVTSITDIWNNEKMLSIRRNILEGSFDDQSCCRSCDQVYKYQTNIAGVPVGYLSALFKDSPLVYVVRRFLTKKRELTRQ